MPAPIPDLSRDQQCHHYQAPSGQRCGSPALKGEYYCYHHIVKQAARTNRRVLIDPEVTRMEIPPIEDRPSIFIALAAVVHRLAENTIDTRRAGQMIYGLQVALQSLPPVPNHLPKTTPAAESDSEPQPVADSSSTTGSAPTTPCQHPAVQPATYNPQPANRTIPISKESLLYFLRSRHCASCNAELFPASELTERPNAGAPPEVIEEARPALPAYVDGTIPSLHAVAENHLLSRTSAAGTHKSGFPIHDTPTVMNGERLHNPHSSPRLLYTHLGARYPRDLRVQFGASLHQPARPASSFLNQ